jgi:hypothetical protein
MTVLRMRFATLLGARAFRNRINTALGLPRCNAPKWSGGTSLIPCPCTTQTGAGVVLTCQHVTRTAVRIRLRAGVYFTILCPRTVAVLLQTDAPESAADDDLDGVDDQD